MSALGVPWNCASAAGLVSLAAACSARHLPANRVELVAHGLELRPRQACSGFEVPGQRGMEHPGLAGLRQDSVGPALGTLRGDIPSDGQCDQCEQPGQADPPGSGMLRHYHGISSSFCPPIEQPVDARIPAETLFQVGASCGRDRQDGQAGGPRARAAPFAAFAPASTPRETWKWSCRNEACPL